MNSFHHNLPKQSTAIFPLSPWMTVGSKQTIAMVVLLGAAIWGVYGRSLNAPFIFDDELTISNNPSILKLWPLVGDAQQPGPLNPPKNLPTAGRPLVNLTIALNYHFGQSNPFGYHFFNICLHWLSALLLAAIVRRTLLLEYFSGRFNRSAVPLSFAVALLWAVHPLQTEAVVYITQRTELMVSFFYFATLYCSLRYWTAELPRSRQLWLGLAVLANLSGMACKEIMVTAPIVVLLFHRTFFVGTFRRAWQKSWPLYVGLALGWGLLLWLNYDGPRSSSAGFHLGTPAYAYWFTQTKVLMLYLKLAVWPWPLTIHYAIPYLDSLTVAWPWLLMAILLTIVILILLWQRNAAGFVGAWILLILSPTFLIPITTEIAAERRMYLPLAALIAWIVAGSYAAASGTVRLWGASNVPAVTKRHLLLSITAIVAAVALCFSLVSVHRLKAYDSGLAMWQDAVINQPNDPIIHTNLSLDLADVGRVEEAKNHAQEALRLKPDYAEAHNAMGLALAKLGKSDEAIDQYRQAIVLDPNFAEAYCNLGAALATQGQMPQAVENFKHAAQLKPDLFQAHWDLARALAGLGQLQESLDQLQIAAGLHPGFAEAQINIAQLLDTMGRFPEAVAHYEEALRLQPNFPEAYAGLTIVYAEMNRRADAIAAAQKALQLASAQGQSELAEQIQAWLNAHAAEPAKSINHPTDPVSPANSGH